MREKNTNNKMKACIFYPYKLDFSLEKSSDDQNTFYKMISSILKFKAAFLVFSWIKNSHPIGNR